VTRIVLVPGVLALLPAYASIEDPVAPVRAACERAVAWLGDDVRVLAEHDQGRLIAEHLLGRPSSAAAGADLLVVGNGSARRTDKAPGHLDERAPGFDDALRAWLWGRGPAPDPALAAQLWASVGALLELVDLVGQLPEPVVVDLDDDPYGVQYWVLRWEV
jgi:hypothetical protein